VKGNAKHEFSGLYNKNIMMILATIVSEAYTINVLLAIAFPLALGLTLASAVNYDHK
jgi:hypothetical protein